MKASSHHHWLNELSWSVSQNCRSSDENDTQIESKTSKHETLFSKNLNLKSNEQICREGGDR